MLVLVVVVVVVGGLRSEGQVGLGGGSPDWGSKVVSALVVQPCVGRALLLVHSQTLQYQQQTHTHSHTRKHALGNTNK